MSEGGGGGVQRVLVYEICRPCSLSGREGGSVQQVTVHQCLSHMFLVGTGGGGVSASCGVSVFAAHVPCRDGGGVP